MKLTKEEHLRALARERNRRYWLRHRDAIKRRQEAERRRAGVRPVSEYLEERRLKAKGRLQTSREGSRQYRLRHPYKIKKANARRIRFLDKAPVLPSNPRNGVCTRCGRVRTPEERQFQMHHLKYNPTNPEDHTIEVCYACHVAIHGTRRRKSVAKS